MNKIQRHQIIVTAATYPFASAPRLERTNMKLRIKLEGESYDVEVEVLPETVDLEYVVPDSVGYPPPRPDTREQDKICRSPIAGIVVSICTHVNQRVRQDAPILVIEAMKMQTTIGASVDGTVQEIHVVPGQSVKPGQPLCTLA